MALHQFDDGTTLYAEFIHPLQWIAYVDSEEDAIVGKGSSAEQAIQNYWEQHNDAVMEAKFDWWERGAE